MRMSGLKSVKVLNMLAKVYHCLRDVHVNSVSSIISAHPFHPVPLVERLHFSFKRTVFKLCFSLAKLSLTSDALCISLCQKTQVLPTPMMHRVPICISSSSRPLVCECSESCSRGLVHSYLCAFNFPTPSHTSRDRQEGSGYDLHEHRILTAEEN